jgi:CheY-like chemotaxis protein
MARIVIADDEAPIREILALILEREGHDVAEAENGEVAEKLVQAGAAAGEPVGLLILDVHMPVMDGLTLHRRLAEQAICPPTIIITGDPHGERIRAAIAGPATVLLEKPFRAQAVLDAVSEALASD